tara:strand:+ start:854 stop:1006 length:153 start_codon:yes stop_codon:yes gene_type:complete
MAKKRLEQLIAERENLNMKIAEINFLINGYESALKAEEKKKEEPKKKKDE